MSEPTLLERARALLAITDSGVADYLKASGARDVAPDLARFAVAFAEALPKLRRDHDSDCTKRRHDGASLADCDTFCGADAHNATIRRLAALLGGDLSISEKRG